MVVRQEAFVQLAPQLLHQSRLLLREIVCFARISYDVKQARAEMGAVNEVADLLQDAIQRAQTDGTYSQQEFGQASPA